MAKSVVIVSDMHSGDDLAIERFSRIGQDDPRMITWAGALIPQQLGEATCLWHYIRRLDPAPSRALRLAAHCQHLRRFAYGRAEFPEGREGYLRWRRDAAAKSAAEAAAILEASGVEQTVAQQVVAIVTKSERSRRRDVQTMEDALCLCFFRLEALEFATKHAHDAVVRILSRTWLKMSDVGRALALAEGFAPPLGPILEQLASVPPKSRTPD